MSTIDEKTKVPLFAVLGSLSAIILVTYYIISYSLKVDAVEKLNDKQDQRIDSQMTLLLDIRDRVIKIESQQKGDSHGR